MERRGWQKPPDSLYTFGCRRRTQRMEQMPVNRMPRIQPRIHTRLRLWRRTDAMACAWSQKRLADVQRQCGSTPRKTTERDNAGSRKKPATSIFRQCNCRIFTGRALRILESMEDKRVSQSRMRFRLILVPWIHWLYKHTRNPEKTWLCISFIRRQWKQYKTSRHEPRRRLHGSGSFPPRQIGNPARFRNKSGESLFRPWREARQSHQNYFGIAGKHQILIVIVEQFRFFS